ncbi:hypothetical protein SBC2_77250 (plasmid) [Caballeronia sp. SBC2]|nr:hypothetical protein SBC2_77250 [Caballeronia sp. SBC2]
MQKLKRWHLVMSYVAHVSLGVLIILAGLLPVIVKVVVV